MPPKRGRGQAPPKQARKDTTAPAAPTVDYKEMYKDKKRKEISSRNKISKGCQQQPNIDKAKKAKVTPKSPKEFTCPLCKVAITGWVVCRNHIFSKHGFVVSRSDVINKDFSPTVEEEEEDDEEERVHSDETDDDKDPEDSDDSDAEGDDNKDEDGDSDADDGWIANAKEFWISHLQKIGEEGSEGKLLESEILVKNSKKKFRPLYMSKKEYVRVVIEAMKEDNMFAYNSEDASFTLVAANDTA